MKMATGFSKTDTQIAKGLAILMMMYHHCFLSADRYESNVINFFPVNEDISLMIAGAMKLCVGIFAFLSAYGMAKGYVGAQEKYGKNAAAAFAVRRYVKLITGFVAAYIVCYVGSWIFGPVPSKYYGTGIKSFICMLIDMTGLSDLFETPMLIGTWWYMTLAVILIFMMPFLMILWEKINYILVILLMTVPYFFGWEITDYVQWIGSVGLGIMFAQMNLFEKIAVWYDKWHLGGRIVVSAVITLLWIPVILFRNSSVFGKVQIPANGFLSLYCIIFSFCVLSKIPVIRKVFKFLGKYSMNIFLIHSFVRVRWFGDFVYSFKNVILIVLVLLGTALLISIALEWVKKVTRYNLLADYLVAKAEKQFIGGR